MIELWVYFVRLLNSSRWISHDGSGFQFCACHQIESIMLRAVTKCKDGSAILRLS